MRAAVAANLKNGGSNDQDADHARGQSAVRKEGADGLPPRSRLCGNDIYRSADDAFLFQLRAQREPNAIRRRDFGGQFLRGVHEAGEVGDIIPAVAAFRHMDAGFLGKRLKPFLLYYKFYVFALHGTLLHG